MNIDSISPVGFTNAAGASALDAPNTRSIQPGEVEAFENNLKAPSAPSIDDFKKAQMEGIVLNMVNEAARQRQELKDAMESQE